MLQKPHLLMDYRRYLMTLYKIEILFLSECENFTASCNSKRHARKFKQTEIQQQPSKSYQIHLAITKNRLFSEYRVVTVV